MSRPENRLAKELRAKGWVEVRRTKHAVWRCGCGQHQTTVATTLGRGRGLANIVSLLSSKEKFGECAIDKRKVLG